MRVNLEDGGGARKKYLFRSGIIEDKLLRNNKRADEAGSADNGGEKDQPCFALEFGSFFA